MDAEGNFSRGIQPEEIKKQRISDWHKKNPNHKIVQKSYYDLMKYAVIVLAVGFALISYSALNDKFKSEITIPSCPAVPSCPIAPACPMVNIPSCPDFPNLTIPSCNNICNFPNNLSINLVNNS